MTSRRPLHVAVTVDPYYPVPPRGYGGHERVVDLLLRGLVARGHRVTVIARADSDVPGRLIPYGVPPHWGLGPRSRELWQVGSALVRLAGRIDLVHSFGRLAALLPILPLRRLPKIQSYGRVIPWAGVRRASRLGGRSITFTACSTFIYSAGLQPGDNRWVTVYNPVETGLYTLRTGVSADAPLVFLGRVEREKGVHAAIAIARRARRRLVIAGNAPDPSYFAAAVAPHLSDTVSYVGEVDDAQKNALLGTCVALLMPIENREAFGLVMIEAMACGTPVIGYRRASVPEVVDDGVTGIVVPDGDVEAAAAAVAGAAALDRARVRATCERRFDASRIVDDYERLYFEVLAS